MSKKILVKSKIRQRDKILVKSKIKQRDGRCFVVYLNEECELVKIPVIIKNINTNDNSGIRKKV